MSCNDVTGDLLVSKIGNKRAFDENFDRIFGKGEKHVIGKEQKAAG